MQTYSNHFRVFGLDPLHIHIISTIDPQKTQATENTLNDS